MTAPLPLLFGDEIFWLLSLSIVAVVVSAVALIVAAVILRVRNNRVARRWAALEAVWDPVMLAVLAGDRPLDDLSRLVAPAEARQFVTYLVRYARRVRGRDRIVMQRLAAPHLPLALDELRDRRAERRAAAVQVLGELGAARYRDELVAALDDPAPLVVVIAAGALAREYVPDHARVLLDRIARLELWTVRFLVSMLQRMGPDASWVFREALADATRPPRLRTIAANVLAVFNDLAAGDVAVRALDDAADTDLRAALVRLIERVGTAEHVAVLRRLTADPVPAVRGAAVRALAAVGGESEAGVIRRAVDDDSHWVAIHAVRALQRLGQTDVLTALVARGHRRASAIHEVLAPEAAG